MDDVKCLTPKCTRTPTENLKGLCMNCYSKAKQAVELGKTSWAELERLGLAANKKDPFDAALEQARQKEAEEVKQEQEEFDGIKRVNEKLSRFPPREG